MSTFDVKMPPKLFYHFCYVLSISLSLENEYWYLYISFVGVSMLSNDANVLFIVMRLMDAISDLSLPLWMIWLIEHLLPFTCFQS